MIAVTTLNFTMICLIQGINDGLLDPLIFFIIQRIDLYRLPKQFLEAVTHLRDRERNDREAALFFYNILSLQLSHLGTVLYQ